MEKSLPLKHEARTFTDRSTNQATPYDVFYVEIDEVKVTLKANDLTSKALLLKYFKG